jgi:hypothetical protein
MSDQQAPQQSEDTPAVAGPDQAPGTAHGEPPYGDPTDPAEKRYNDLRSWTDRVAQENAELRSYKDKASEAEQRQQWYDLALTTDDPDTQRRALQHLGFDVPNEVEDVEPTEWDDEDPLADVRKELAELRSWKEQSTQQQQQEVQQQFFDSYMEMEIERLGLDKLDTRQQEMVFDRLRRVGGIPAPPGTPIDEYPNVEAAYKLFQEEMLEEQKSWASVKKRAPYVPSGGQSANEVPDPGTGHNSRMNRAMRALMEQQE